MYFVLFGAGAIFLQRLPLPGPLTQVVGRPPPEALYAVYFLLAALLRLLIRDARVAAAERSGRAARARRGEHQLVAAPPGLVDIGAGVGKGVAEVVLGGDLLGAALTGAAMVLRFAASRRDDPAEARRAAGRRRAIGREHRRALLCIVGVGALCAAAVWLPLLRPRLAATLASLLRAARLA